MLLFNLAGYEAGIKAADDKVPKETLKKIFEEESVKLKKQEKALKDFCNQTGRRYESARTQVYAVLDVKGNIVGFNRSVAQKAVWPIKIILQLLKPSSKVIQKQQTLGQKLISEF